MDIPYIDTIQDAVKSRKVQCFLVGGFLRDVYVGVPQNDFDFAVSKDALKVARVLAKQIKGSYILLDEEHACARVAKKIKGVLFTFDFADFRAKTIKGDLALRDFTVNTLAVNIENIKPDSNLDEIIFTKAAKADFQTKTVRMVKKKAFADDPLRILRAFALTATHNFKIAKETQEQIKKDAALIDSVSYERITTELFKILESPRAYHVIKSMDRLKVLDRVIPQIKIMYGCTQGAYHHLDVWRHSLETIKQFDEIVQDMRDDRDTVDYLDTVIAGDRRRKGLIRLALLLHDIGKPDTRKKRPEGGYSFYSHEYVGKKIAHHVCKLLKLSTKERRIVEDMVQYHLRPGYISNFKRPSAKMLLRYFRDTADEAASIALLSLADQRSTRGPMTTDEDQKHHEKICQRLVKDYFNKKKEEPFVPLLTGRDLIEHLKLKPSPLFGKILKQIEEEQLLGKVKTKEEALAKAKNLVKTIS